MNESTLRTIDILSRRIGKPVSINKLVEKIHEKYGTAYYRQIYDEIKKLKENNEIDMIRSGKSTLPFLNFNNPLLIDKLSQIELERKIRFLHDRKELELIIFELMEKLRKYELISSMGIVNPERNAKLNRIELIIMLRNFESDNDWKPTFTIRKRIDAISALHNIRIDPLLIQENNFIELLKDDNANIVKNILSNKIIISNPQNFWMIIKSMSDNKIQFSTDNEINPAKITEDELMYNLAKFGYKEFGHVITKESSIRIEYIITAILLRKEVRMLEAIPIILIKTETKVNYNLLLFLSQKYDTASKLLGVLNAIREYKHIHGVKIAIRNLKALKTEEIKANFDDLERKMRLYHVIR
ncbi:hypothetical protein [Nitrosopumilus sp. Nsub]|uniref:hypothetical protein n=1 Tax=Nitrosopumilus sp. Nsub TaxID=1776294 RepID=UPI000835CF95|nr:hypothetical protein [Nitrosopumilus sp. Nsub]